MREAVCADRICVHADHVIEQGALVIEDGRVLEVTTRQALQGASFPVRELGACTIVPAPVNAHTHLEFSHLKGRTTLGQGFAAWVRSVLRQGGEPCPESSLLEAAAQLRACGVAHVADVCSRQPRDVARALEQAGPGLTLCAEVMGFAPLPESAVPLPGPYLQAGERVTRLAAGAGHALYTTSPERLQRARAWSREQGRPFFLHLAEHQEEVDLLTRGDGGMAELLQSRLLPRGWKPPGVRPVAYAHRLGLLGPDTVAVHCVQLDEQDLALLGDSGATACLCPRSNEAIGVGVAPVARLLEAGVPCCLGTDSLASNHDLDIWAELRHVLLLLRPSEHDFWRLVTGLCSGNAARVLGLERLGALAPGKDASWCIVPSDIEMLQQH